MSCESLGVTDPLVSLSVRCRGPTNEPKSVLCEEELPSSSVSCTNVCSVSLCRPAPKSLLFVEMSNNDAALMMLDFQESFCMEP